MVKIDGYLIDAALVEAHDFDAEITQDPIEEGANASDHYKILPVPITIEGIVSNTPIGAAANERTPLVDGRQIRNNSDASQPSTEAYQHILRVRDRREPVTIETSLGVFDDMMLISFNVPRDARTGAALRFRATFQQIRILSNERTVVPVAQPVSAKSVNRGWKATKENNTEPKAFIAQSPGCTAGTGKYEGGFAEGKFRGTE